MSFGTAAIILGILYLAAVMPAFRAFCFGIVSLAGILVLGLIIYGADKPQTIFYNHEAHPAFLMQAGGSCPSDRHVWNHWCVK